jgi:Cathepsin propeptide inhibitor domain (I29)/Papain family cysteine protease
MNKSTILVALLAVIAAGALYKFKNLDSINEVPQEVVFAFNQWKMTQKKLYASPEEHNHRLNVFHLNYVKVNSVNQQKLSYTFKLNDFSDLSHEEFSARYLQKPQEHKTEENVQILTAEDFKGSKGSLQQGVDNNWCAAPFYACSAVRLQGQCVAGYAFASAKVLEYAFNVAKLSQNQWLSPQEYINCSQQWGNKACSGGSITASMAYSINRGLSFD